MAGRHGGAGRRRGAGRLGWDVAAASALVAAAPVAEFTLPGGSATRLAIAFLGLLAAPGYLLSVTVRPWGNRLLHLALAPGFSIPLVGLAALATALVPHGFHEGPIAAAELGVGALAATGAGLRRWFTAKPSHPAGPGAAPLPQAAIATVQAAGAETERLHAPEA